MPETQSAVRSRSWTITLVSVLGVALIVSCASFACRPSATSGDWQLRLASAELTQSEFTRIVADAAEEALPKAQVKVAGKLHIEIARDGTTSCYLDNLWQQVRAEPARRTEHVLHHLEVLESTMALMEGSGRTKLSDVVPVIKDARWLSEAERQQLDVLRHPLAGDLYVVFAHDGEHQLAYVSPEEVAAWEISMQELQTAAVQNLRSRLEQPQRHGEGPLYMLTAGGTFEASLLLLDEVWQEQDRAVDGDLVVAVPSRDVLLFTGSNAPEAIQEMQRQVATVMQDASYLISDTLLVRQGPTWREYVSTP